MYSSKKHFVLFLLILTFFPLGLCVADTLSENEMPMGPLLDLPPLCAPEKYWNEIGRVENEYVAADFLQIISEYHKNYAAPSFLNKWARFSAIYRYHQEIFPDIQPCLASDSEKLGKLAINLRICLAALFSNYDETTWIDCYDASEKSINCACWTRILTSRARFVQARLQEELDSGAFTQNDLREIITAAIKRLVVKKDSAKIRNLKRTDSEFKIARERHLRNQEVAKAFELLIMYLPEVPGHSCDMRLKSLQMGIQGVMDILSIPVLPAERDMTSLEYWWSERELCCTAGSANRYVENLILLPEKTDKFALVVPKLKKIVADLQDLGSSIQLKDKDDDEWPDYVKEKFSVLSEIIVRLREVKQKLSELEKEAGIALKEGDFDECSVLFDKYPNIDSESLKAE